ncbi:hypothetical protein L6452_44687 [Arctium lappa]|uniref:Uncharacterized protein n=1 Tax=Arctium lappa TaxID=4217 RepID=A0ACB8XGT4_ARCLA|nr:hypothetical protein L6452_44687 [Arctium lappa]
MSSQPSPFTIIPPTDLHICKRVAWNHSSSSLSFHCFSQSGYLCKLMLQNPPFPISRLSVSSTVMPVPTTLFLTTATSCQWCAGAEVRIDCRFNAASPRTAEQISFTVNRTTNRHGVYKMDIPSVDGFNCAREASILNTCRASLIRSTSPDCNVPASITTSNQFSVKSKQANLCIYSLYALSFRPSKKDLAICGK